MPDLSAKQAAIEFAAYISPNGCVRLRYRATFTGRDAFDHTYLVSTLSPDTKQVLVGARVLARWALDQFAITIETRPNESADWSKAEPFSWDVLDRLTGIHAADGWPAIAATQIYQNVVGRHAENLDALKKTALTSSGPASPATTPGARASRSSTSRGSARR